MKNHISTFESFMNESGFHAALAKAKEQGLEEFEFAGKKYKVQKDALEESQEVVNEAYVPFPPELAKDLEKDLAPLIKAYSIEVKSVSPSSLGGGLPVLNAIGYDLQTNNWVAGTFFTKKDAEAAKDLFEKSEVKSIIGKNSNSSSVKNSSMGITLFGDEMEKLADAKRIKIDFEKIRSKVADWENTQK